MRAGLTGLLAAAATAAVAVEEVPQEGLPVAAVRWRTVWHGVDKPVDTVGGTRIALTDLSFTHHSLSLVPCPAPKGAWDRLAGLVVGTAWADHAPWDDPSRVTPHAAWTAHEQPLTVGEVEGLTDRYCKVHWMAAPAGRGDPIPPDRSARTLRASGTWTDPQGHLHPFETETAWTQADTHDLNLHAARPQCVTVTVHRHLPAAVQHVDPRGEPLEIAWALLDGVRRATTVQVEMVEAGEAPCFGGSPVGSAPSPPR